MLSANRFAFKEWAVNVCGAGRGTSESFVAKGRNPRTGRPLRGRARRVLAISDAISSESGRDSRRRPLSLLRQVADEAPTPGVGAPLALRGRRRGDRTDATNRCCRGWPICKSLAEHTFVERFHYRRPGLFVLPVRIYRRAEPMTLVDTPHFAGCRTWVDLEQELAHRAA